MNKLVKRLVSGALSLVLVGALSVSAFAVGDSYTTSNASAGGSAVDELNDGSINYELHLNEYNDGYLFDLTYAWDEAMTWTYLRPTGGGTGSGAWFRQDEKIGGKGFDTLNMVVDAVAIKNAVAGRQQAIALETNGEKQAKEYGVKLTITNKNTSYKLKYEVTGGTTDLEIKKATLSAGVVDSLTDGATATLDEFGGTTTENVLAVYPKTIPSSKSETVSGNVTIHFSAIDKTDGTSVAGASTGA